MGDVLVDALNADFRLRDGSCPECEGNTFRVTLEPDCYIVHLDYDLSEPDIAFGQAGPEIIQVVCNRCGHEVSREEECTTT